MDEDIGDRFSWRMLQPHEAQAAHCIHLAAIADQAFGLVRPDELPHFIAHTGAAGAIVGCFAEVDGNEQMLAYGVLGTDSSTSSHMAELLCVAPADRARFAILDGVAALPDWRGYGLHRASIQARLDHARTVGRSLIGATVSPENIASLRGLLESRFLVTNFAMLYGGLARLVLKRDLNDAMPAWSLEQKIDTNDRAANQAALAVGQTAYACSQSGNRWQLHYGYPV
ncbi:hypothetical protein ACO0LO_22570 [Undibacterium sp. TJN25]|uniref:hypothetical protein n=1 Tax=Undibacterium sp. TJN25 TaxID=3413056 RepID=UPI003BF0AA36